MAMVKITPQFKSSDERNIIALAIGLTIPLACYLSFVPPLIAYFAMPDKLSDSGKLILRQFSNFMINVAIIVWLLSITLIGIPIAILVAAAAFIFVILELLSVLNNSEITIPVLFEALKESSDMKFDKPNDDNNNSETN